MENTSKKFRYAYLWIITFWALIYLIIHFDRQYGGTVDLNRTIGWGWDTGVVFPYSWIWIPIIIIGYWGAEQIGSVFNTILLKMHVFTIGLLTFSYLPFVFYDRPSLHDFTFILVLLGFAVNIVIGGISKTRLS